MCIHAHLRDPFRTDEAACLDGRHTRAAESVDELDLDGGRDDGLLVLQPIARPDFNDVHEVCMFYGCRVTANL